MPVAVLNVRPSRQRTPELARVDARNKELALRSIGEKVVLYAPADEIRHGYFATARLVDVRPDMTQRRFMFIVLADVNTFGRFISLDELTVPVESRAYRADGSRDFSYFSLSIRPLGEADRAVARSLEQQERAFSGFEMPALPAGAAGLSAPIVRRHRPREQAIRDARLRWAVLDSYGAACAVCGDDHGVAALGIYAVEVCHLRGVKFGGADELTNAMPMCRRHHWDFDHGLFALSNSGQIIGSRYMTSAMRQRFNGRVAASFPMAAQARPKAEHLQFHREHIFLG